MVARLLNGSEVAQILGISRSQAYSLMRTGAIEVVRFGRTVRVTEEGLKRFIKEATVGANSFCLKTKLPAVTESRPNISANATD
jgi:excisionase family DNA binding protein